MPSHSANLEETLKRAFAEANSRRHEYMTLEHLLLALIDDPDAKGVLEACAVVPEELRHDVAYYIDTDLKNLVWADGEEAEAKPTNGIKRTLQRAIVHVQSANLEEVTGANVLVGIFGERDSHAVYFLKLQELTRYDAVNYIVHGIPRVPQSEPAAVSNQGAAVELILAGLREVLSRNPQAAEDAKALLKRYES